VASAIICGLRSFKRVNRNVGPVPAVLAAARREHDTRVHQLADLLRRTEHDLGLSRAHHDRLGDDVTARGAALAVLIREQIGHLELAQLGLLLRDAVAREEIVHRRRVGGDALLRASEIVVGGREAQRPERDVGLHVALGDAFHRDVAVRRAAADEAVPDEPPRSGQTHGENRGGEKRTIALHVLEVSRRLQRAVRHFPR
jgi:hypothetical protein